MVVVATNPTSLPSSDTPRPVRRNRSKRTVMVLAALLAVLLLVTRPWHGAPPRPLWVFRGAATVTSPTSSGASQPVAVATSIVLECLPGGTASGVFDTSYRQGVGGADSTTALHGTFVAPAGSDGCHGDLSFVPNTQPNFWQLVALRVTTNRQGGRVVTATFSNPVSPRLVLSHVYADVPAARFHLGPPDVTVR